MKVYHIILLYLHCNKHVHVKRFHQNIYAALKQSFPLSIKLYDMNMHNSIIKLKALHVAKV